MDNLLLKYMNERVRHATKKVVEPGPVITISRECGCSGRLLAEKLTERINEKIDTPAKGWRWVSKEILNLASEELKIQPDQIREILKGDTKNFLDEIVFSFTDKYYVNNAKIKKVIGEMIWCIAVCGKAVILGRGSEVVTNNIPRSLHIKLSAPLNWRIQVISERNNILPEEAKKIIIKVDNQRLKFRDAFLEKDQAPIAYDIEFNCAKFSQEEIIYLIMKAADIKSFL